MKIAVLSIKEGHEYCLHIGAWDDPEKMVLQGFDTMFDAWAFAICHGLDDPYLLIPEKFRQWTNKPKPELEVLQEGQMTLL